MPRDRLELAAWIVNQQIVCSNGMAAPVKLHTAMSRKTESPDIRWGCASLVQDPGQAGLRQVNLTDHSLADASPESPPVELSEIEVPGLCDLRQLVHIVEFMIDDERRNGFVEIRNGRFLMRHGMEILFNIVAKGKQNFSTPVGARCVFCPTTPRRTK